MDTLAALVQSLHADPRDAACWLALADCLEETGEPERGELMRLRTALLAADVECRPEMEVRLRALVDAGVRPVVPAVVNSVGMVMALIPPGGFWMGSPEDEPARHPDEGPRRRVTLTRPFYLGVHPVTQAQYERALRDNPSRFRAGAAEVTLPAGTDTSAFPVEQVSWHDADRFCRNLGSKPTERAEGRMYRLPTEAEWEYACRAGSTTAYHFGDELPSTQANVKGDQPEGDLPPGPYLERPCEVGQYPPNAFGLFDMHGNVFEWCRDWHDEEYYRAGPAADPPGPRKGSQRVLRGGAWFYGARIARSAYRYAYVRRYPSHLFGFRVVLEWKG
jgi:uncharacterized protein (TIGR02996 family)